MAISPAPHNVHWARFWSKLFSYSIVVLTVLILYFFLILPVFVVLKKALFTPQGEFGFGYFELLFANSLQTSAITNSIGIGFFTTILATLLSLPLALINRHYSYRGKTFLSALLLVPMIMPPFVGAIGVQRFFARFGSVNMLLMDWSVISDPIDWLSGTYMFWAVVVLEALHLYPILYLNLSAALGNVDPSLEEMGVTLGISRVGRLLRITWPLARPGFFAGAIIVFIWALTDLGTPLLVGFHDTLPVRIFNLVTDVNENPVGFALVFIVIVMTVSFFLLSKLMLGSTKKFQMMARGHVTSPLTEARWFNLSYIYPLVLGISLVALIPHISVIITSIGDQWFMTALPENYTLRYYAAVFEQQLSLIGIKNSFFFSSLSTLVDVVLGLLIAVIVSRKLVPFAGLLDALVMIPLALPGIVLAFGYVVTYSNTWLDPLHNPVPLLVIAYAIRRLPFMVRSASAGLQQSSVFLEEASQSLGASSFRTLRMITMPLVMANLIAGGLLCFSYAMLDVSDSLILAMKDQFYPMTKSIYVLYLEQGSGEFIASALGVIGMGILTVCILGSSVILGKKMGELFRS
jgi:iron(III) transport system permease protein